MVIEPLTATHAGIFGNMSAFRKILHEMRLVWRDVAINGAVGSPFVSPLFRWRILKLLGYEIGNARIRNRVWIGSRNIRIGNGTFISDRVVFDTHARIDIGENVDIAMDARFITSTHESSESARRAGRAYSLPITVGDGAWIGAGAMVLPGVTIGERTIVAAGAVVHRDCLPDSVYAGVPATLKSH